MFNWLSGRKEQTADTRAAADTSRLEEKIEQLEQTVRHLAKETRKQNVVVRQLHIHHPVLENVTFRLDALDIEELSGSLNLGNNFDVQLDPESLFRGGKNKTPDNAAVRTGPASPDTAAHGAGAEADATEPDEALRRTSSGFSYRTTASPAPRSRKQAPNPNSPSRRKL